MQSFDAARCGQSALKAHAFVRIRGLDLAFPIATGTFTQSNALGYGKAFEHRQRRDARPLAVFFRFKRNGDGLEVDERRIGRHVVGTIGCAVKGALINRLFAKSRAIDRDVAVDALDARLTQLFHK